MASLKDILGLRKFPHYYGDVVRILFFLAGILMILSLPLLDGIILVPVHIAIFSILILIFIAGLTNPVQKWVSIIDSIVSSAGFIVFEYYAVSIFSQGEEFLFFLINQTLAVLFLFAFYFATKTVRGFLVKERKE
jgi:hypothetical protein